VDNAGPHSPDLLQEALVKFDDHFQNMIAEILRVPCLTEDQWEQASLPVKLAGLGVNQTKVIAGPAFIGSCCLTKDLVAALLKQDSSAFEPSDVKSLLADHEVATGITHELPALSDAKKVQQLLSSERDEATFKRLKSKLGVRSHNLMLACSMSHASDWLLAPPIPGLGLSLQSDVFRTALKFRLSMPLFEKPSPCPAVSSGSGTVCDAQMDVFGDHALCCLYFLHSVSSQQHQGHSWSLGKGCWSRGGRD
jgi:hypothetical protein